MRSFVSLYKAKQIELIMNAIRRLIIEAFNLFLDAKITSGEIPINSSFKAVNGSVVMIVSIPSLPPLFGSLICHVKNASNTPGKPTSTNAACQPLSDSGARLGSGYASVHSSTIQPPRKRPIPAPRYTPLE